MNTDTPSQTCVVSIIIKALNEEKRIATAIESALQAVDSVGGEVILADSYSTDRTIEIAERYPIKIVQLANPNERCCGIGPQLGYQFARGKFVYILDGDMQMLPDFLPKALEFMRKTPQAGGVGGQVIEMNTQSLEFLARVERAAHHMQPGLVDRLDMGGLYRKSAIDSVGYFSNRNLHSYEELDLAVRLRSKNWKLYRIESEAVRHWGHDAPPYQLLTKRWKTRYINGLGEVLRAAIGKPHLKLLLKDIKELRIYLATIVWWLVLIVTLFLPLNWGSTLALFSLIAIAPIGLMSIRKKSFSKALYSVISWNFNAAGLIRGLFSSQATLAKIDSTFSDITHDRP
ncbi:glycosyltransferase family 2 protein [Thiomicrorhabdus sp.]|uniref:glycosyltransferase family 2 protein n=1 Tax=Thiomicrorhabdus sp. TaxID=2039724 RepID=UPI00356A1B46